MAPVNSDTVVEKERNSQTSKSSDLHNDRSWNTELVRTITRRWPQSAVPPTDPLWECPVCQQPLDSEETLGKHFSSTHGSDFKLDPAERRNDRRVAVDRRTFGLGMVQRQGAVPTFLIRVGNKGELPVTLSSIYIFDGDVRLLKIFSGEQLLSVGSGNRYEYVVSLDDLVLVEGRSYSILVAGTPVITEGDSKHKIVEQYLLTGPKKVKRTELELKALPPFQIWRSLVVLFQNQFKANDDYKGEERNLLKYIETAKSATQSLTPSGYRKQLHVLNQIEVCHLVQEYGSYTLCNPILEAMDCSRYFSISIKQFDKKPVLLSEDVTVKLITQGADKPKSVYGVITKVTPTKIVVLMQKSVNAEEVTKVMFKLNRLTFQLEQNALNLMKTQLIKDICFPEAIRGGSIDCIDSFKWIQPGISSNKEQKTAIQNIVNQTSFPAPYVLFGPPGTGKTSTLVEAIAQIHRLRPTANILVTATSNFAANELTSRLLKAIPAEDIFRYFSNAISRKMEEIDDDIIDVSNMSRGSYGDICYEDIYNSRVLVTTLAMAGRLVQADIKAKHFSYIFIDECGSAKEASSLIPIAGLATSGNEIHASVVLAGDPKQLGPVMQCEFLKQTTHCLSMLERLMDLPLYGKDSDTKEYNTKAVTQLRDSFRSHEKLLEFCNNEFYDGQLRAKAPNQVKQLAVGWWRLPNRKCPLIFYPVNGHTEQDKGTSSFFNKKEAFQVMFYVADLLKNGINGKAVQQADIGIVSPYSRQVVYLKQWCTSRNWCDIEVGSAEQFQGREKPIIIVSTVRSRCGSVGFLSDAKRLNVTLTRARSLLIVIGNPETLQLDPLWRKFVGYCLTNGAVYQPNGKKSNWKWKEMKIPDEPREVRNLAEVHSDKSSVATDEISMDEPDEMSDITIDWFDHIDRQQLRDIINNFYRV